jgi:hypothetical protein
MRCSTQRVGTNPSNTVVDVVDDGTRQIGPEQKGTNGCDGVAETRGFTPRLDGPVLDLRDTTQVKYRSIVEGHLRPRFDARPLDGIAADDVARLVRELRAEAKSEATIAVAVAVIGRIYKFAARRLGWNGTIPTTLMLHPRAPLSFGQLALREVGLTPR